MKKSVFYSHIVTAAEQEGVSVAEMIAEARTLGYTGVDVEWRGRDALLTAHELLSAAEMEIVSVYRFCDPALPLDEAEMRGFFESLVACGSDKAMVIPAYYSEGGDREAELRRACERLREICALATEYGVTVSVEDFDKESVIVANTETLRYALRAVPMLRYTFDTGNYAYFGESALSAYGEFRDRIVHVHLKDRACEPFSEGEAPTVALDGTLMYSSPVGKGRVEIAECLSRLCRDGYDGYVTVEHFRAARMKEYMRASAEYIDRVLAALTKE